MRKTLRLFAMLGIVAGMASMATAYSYFVFYAGNSSPFAPLPGRFDLTALKDNTVQFFISNQGPGPLMPGDSTTAIYSQIEQAARAWDGVPGSSIHMRFGGITGIGVPQVVPGIDVIFDDDMPPGIIAQTKPTFPSDLSFLPNKGVAFVPMLRATVQLRRDLTAAGYQQSSQSDAFFTTLVHEFGHALGLQHTLTSSVMSTAITRATTKGAPLAADDIAGISLLYPAGSYLAGTGSITGTVTLGGAGINMASVVALSTNGTALSGLTNPDGSYRIDAVPPGQYYIYAHPLPPPELGEASPANIVPQRDPQSDTFAAYTTFGTQFYPGTTDWTQATAIGVTAGNSVNQVNFAVAARPSGPAVYAMETYGYQNGVAIAAPPLPTAQRNTMVFYAPGTTVSQQTAIAPGLGVTVIGGAAQIETGSLQYYTQGFLEMVVDTPTVTANLPAALAVTVNGDLYVLPAAFTVVPDAPPAITGVLTQQSVWGLTGTVVTGSNLSASTSIQFDGAPAAILSANSDGSLNVTPPPALSGQQSAVEAVNPDGQTSAQALGSAAPPIYPYPLGVAVTVAAAPAAIVAGADVMLSITGVNTHFASGQTVAGFGSSDVAVRRCWVVNPNLLLVNVTVNAGAQVGAVNLTVATGLEIVTLSGAVNVTAANPAQVSLLVPVTNAVTALAGVPAGGTALISTSGFPASAAGWTLSIGGEAAAFTADKNGVLTVALPGDLAVGPQIVQLTAPASLPGVVVPPVLMQLDAPPPAITAAADNTAAAANGPAVPVTASTPAALGDTVSLTVIGLSDGYGVLPAAGSVWIDINGVNYPTVSVVKVPPTADSSLILALVEFVLPTTVTIDPTASAPTATVMVGTGTRLSAGYALNIAAPPAAVAAAAH
jgi:hypothetical protein